MKETIQRLFGGSKRFPGPNLSRLNAGKAIGVLLLAVVAIALSLANAQPTSSAVVKNTENNSLPEPAQSPSPPACNPIPPANCFPNPNGEGTICCFPDEDGDRTCRFQSESCQSFDNPCDPDNPVFVFVRTTLVSKEHIDRKGGKHYHTHLEMHGDTPLEGQCTELSVGQANRNVGSSGFAFVKTSTSLGSVFNLVRNSSYNSSGPPPETFGDPLTIHIITQGGAENFTLHSVLHTTRNANGEITACITRENASCETPSQ